MKRIALALLSLWLVACPSGDPKPDPGTDRPGPTGTAKPAPESAAPLKVEVIKLARVDLQAELPAGSKVTDAIGGEGHMVMSPVGPFNIMIAGPDKPRTLEEAKKAAEVFKPKNFQSETLPDGWALLYEREDAGGTTYWLTLRREIGGKAYVCDTAASSEAQRGAALAACKSLRP